MKTRATQHRIAGYVKLRSLPTHVCEYYLQAELAAKMGMASRSTFTLAHPPRFTAVVYDIGD